MPQSLLIFLMKTPLPVRHAGINLVVKGKFFFFFLMPIPTSVSQLSESHLKNHAGSFLFHA